MSVDTGVGKHLRRLRKARGLTLMEVARRTGMSHQAVSRLELGRDPQLSTILRYCNAIGARIHIGLADQAHTDTSTKGA